MSEVQIKYENGGSVDDDGDDYGLRVESIPIVHRSRQPEGQENRREGGYAPNSRHERESDKKERYQF